MNTGEQRAEQFKTELREFLKSWDTELQVNMPEDWEYAPFITCYLSSVWVEGNLISEGVDVNLGSDFS